MDRACDADERISRYLLASGGASQQRRVLAAEASAPSTIGAPARSELVDRILMLVGWGIISANTARWLAEGACMDGVTGDELVALSRLGKSGKFAGNARRDLLRSFLPTEELPSLTLVKAPTKDKFGNKSWQGQFVMNPCTLLHTLYTSYRSEFEKMVVSIPPRQFWNQVDPRDPKFARLASMLAIPDWRDRAVPYLLHGDGAVFTKKNQNSLLGVQFSSLLADKTAPINIFPLFAVAKECRTTIAFGDGESCETLGPLWDAAIHYLNALYNGLHEKVDQLGQPWAKGTFEYKLARGDRRICGGEYFFVCWGLTHDLEYESNELKLAHFASARPCKNCGVEQRDGTATPITDLRRDGAWSTTLVADVELRTLHAIKRLEGVTIHHFAGDWMHTVCLGLLSYLLASVIADLLDLLPGSKTDKLSALWSLITQAFSTLCSSHRIATLTYSMFEHADGFACMTTKAAENVDLLYALQWVAAGLCGDTARDRHRTRVLDAMCCMYGIIKNGDIFLDEARFRELRAHADVFCLHYRWLTHDSINRLCVMRYHIVFKHHHFIHVVDAAQWMNPRATWCYTFEDFMGILVTSAKACIAGSSMRIIGNKVLENWLLVLGLRLFQSQNVSRQSVAISAQAKLKCRVRSRVEVDLGWATIQGLF